jgi:acetyl-CoA C-acetyltransferase
MTEAWIIDVARTPRGLGKPGKGALTTLHPQRILSSVLRALAERSRLNTAEIDDVVIGCGTQIGKQGSCIARMASLDAGYDNAATGFALDRFCGSGLTAVNVAAMGVISGAQDLVVAGGVESMSYGFSLPPMAGGLIDSGNEHLRALHPQPHQGVCGDLIATLEGFTREQLDRFALESQRRAGSAVAHGRFAKSLIPVYHDDGTLALDHEEYPRPQTTLEALASLKPAFESLYSTPLNEEGLTHKKLVERTHPGIKINHVHHAGNSSGVVDGAGAVLLASPQYAKAHGLRPRGRIVAIATAGDAPETMLNAPAPAARKALKKAGMTMKDIDLFEVNEAFAAVPMKFIREMDADPEKMNVNGGAIALGHPIGATGAILLGTLLDELERRNLETGLVTLCTGGGMAPCTIIQRVQ